LTSKDIANPLKAVLRNHFALLLVGIVALGISINVKANDYVIQNNTQYPQFVRFVYTSPIGQGPLSFTIQAHGQRSDTFNAPGYTAMVEIDAGPYKIYHNGQQWSGPLVFGDGSNVSPPGIYALNPASAGQHSTSHSPSTTTPSQPYGPGPKWNSLLPTNSTDDTITFKQLCSFTASGVRSIAVGNRSIIYGVKNDYYISTDYSTGYTNWTKIQNPPPGVPYLISDGKVYINITTNLYFSVDGLNWKDILNTTGYLTLVYWDDKDLVFRNGTQFYISHDLGKTWDIQPFPQFFFPLGYSYMWGDKGTLVASVIENTRTMQVPTGVINYAVDALAISHDDGKTWSITDIDSPQWGNPISTLFGADRGVIAHVAADAPETPRPYYSYLHESWDNGKTWELEQYPNRYAGNNDLMAIANGYIIIMYKPAGFTWQYLRDNGNGFTILAKRKGEGWHHVEVGSAFSVIQKRPIIIETIGPDGINLSQLIISADK
jgi:hypothetical protein